MRRTAVFALAGLALTALLAVGASGAGAKIKKKKEVETAVTGSFTAGPPSGEEYYSSATFSGKVSAAKNKCAKNRSVAVKRPNGSNVGQTTSDGNGNWTLLASTLAPGQYSVEVDKSKTIKKKTKKNGEKVKKKVVCLPATANVTIPG